MKSWTVPGLHFEVLCQHSKSAGLHSLASANWWKPQWSVLPQSHSNKFWNYNLQASSFFDIIFAVLESLILLQGPLLFYYGKGITAQDLSSKDCAPNCSIQNSYKSDFFPSSKKPAGKSYASRYFIWSTWMGGSANFLAGRDGKRSLPASFCVVGNAEDRQGREQWLLGFILQIGLSP